MVFGDGLLDLGMRRGELVGLDRPDVGLDRRRLHVRQAQPDDELDDVKSEDSDRIVIFDLDTEKVLRSWLQRQREERLAAGPAWRDSGRFFTREDGRALDPPAVSQHFARLIRRYNTIREHHAHGWTIDQITRRSRVTPHEAEMAIAGRRSRRSGCTTCGTVRRRCCSRPGST